MPRRGSAQTGVAVLSGVILLACGGIPTAPEGALVLTSEAPSDLPEDVEALLAAADRATARGPLGPDPERALAALQRILWVQPEHAGAISRALRTFQHMTVGADTAETARLAHRCQPLASRAAGGTPNAETALYAATCLGHFAKATDNLKLVGEVLRLLKAARAADPRVEHGGPDRVLGAIHLRAPPWPISVGDLDLAIEHSEAAVELAPGWPENQLVLAEALLADDREGDAAKVLDGVAARLDDPRYAPWRSVWLQTLAHLRR